MRSATFGWASVAMAFAVALSACQETGSTSNPSTAGGASGFPFGGTGGVGFGGFGGASGLGAAGAAMAGTGGAPIAGSGFAGTGAGGMFGAGTGGTPGTSGMGAGTGGMPGTSGVGAGTGGMSGAGGQGGMGAGTGGMSGAGGQGGMGSSGPTFAPVYAIIMAKCGGGISGCHVTGSSGGLRMPNAAMAYDNLVGVASAQCAGETRVVAGDADGSLIVQAIEGNACVDPMPDGRAALPAGEIAMFRAWIDGGARE